MKKNNIVSGLLLLAGAAALVLPPAISASGIAKTLAPEVDLGPAPSFEGERTVRLENPDIMRANEDEDYVSASKVILHYHNDDKSCLNRRFYTWVTGVDGLERKPDAATWTSEDMTITLDFADIPEYAEMDGLYFIIKFGGTWAGQSEDMFLSYKDFAPDANGLVEVWMIPGEGSTVEVYKTEAETKFPKVKTAKFTDFKTIHCVADETPMYYKLYAFDKEYLRGSTEQKASGKEFRLFKQSNALEGTEFDIKFNYTAKINIQYVVETEYASNPGRIQSIIVSCENLYEYMEGGQSRFDRFYTYDGDDLGATYTPSQTTFKVWSPISSLVVLNLYNTGTPRAFGGSDLYTGYVMNYTAGGVWQVTILGDLKGSYYTYSFTHSSGTVEAMDPYAKACGINGIRGYVYDKNETNPTEWSKVWDGSKGNISSPQDLAIYEVHIRDLTMDDSWGGTSKKGTFNAFIEKGTRYTEPVSQKTFTTGFDHIEELGVNAVQLLPVFDHDDDERPDKMKFNWGYNPLNYNCVEGGYSSDPYQPLVRIKEYKELVKAFYNNNNTTRVIMDVVYNHVSSASASCFTKAMPKYYFRYTENWEYYDGSGCNNEVKTDAKMMSKYIVDSLCWWATEYKIKGFRFDLMGLIDSWTLRAAKEALAEIDPSIYIYGEGWTSGGYHGKYELNGEGKLINGGTETALAYEQLYASDTSKGRVGAFNDRGRNETKGSNDGGYGTGNLYPSWGFVSQGGSDVGSKAQIVSDMMMGIHTDKGGNPTQTINYMSCHDNYTLWDQLSYTLAPGYKNKIPTGDADVLDTVRASLSCHAAVMMSNGVAFMQGGEELYRTKSYSPEELERLTEGGENAIVRPYPTWPSWDEAAKDPVTGNPIVPLATDDVIMANGRVISHNSYKSSDELNSFKWYRKAFIGDTDVSEYFEVWKAMVSTRRNLHRYDYPDNCTKGIIDSWVNDEGNWYGATVFGMWNADDKNNKNGSGYYFVFANRMGGTLGIGLDNTTLAFATRNDYTFNGGKLTLKPFTFICYRKLA